MTDSDITMRTLFGLIRLNANYAYCLDEDRLEEWPAFFLEDCHYMVTNAENFAADMQAGVIWADSRSMLADRVSALREANIYEQHAYRHIVGLPQIRRTSEDGGLHTETPFTVLRITGGQHTEVFASGKYVDVVHHAHEQPILGQRIAVCDSNLIDTLLAIPL